MSKQANPYPLRVDKTILEKSKYIASQNGRSLNKEIEFNLKTLINEFERQHGEIIISQNISKE